MTAAAPPTAATAANAANATNEDVTTTLYRAAIGPVNTGYFLPIFTRFENANHAGISWNTAASLTTLNWLVFRRLWGAAVAYAAILFAVLLLVFGVGRLVFQFSETLQWTLLLGFGLAAFVLPGLFANAVLHTDCRKRMAKALAAHTDIAAACSALTGQASTRRRALALAIVNAVVLAIAIFAYLQFSALSDLTVMPQGAVEPGHVVVGRTLDANASAVLPVTDLPASKPVTAPVAAASVATVASAAVSAPSVPLSPASAASGPAMAASATAPAPAASTTQAPASTPVTAASAAKSAPLTPKPHQAAASKPVSKPITQQVVKKLVQQNAPAKPVKDSKADKSDKAYFINVGLFAKPENAAGAHAKLLAAELPSVTKELKTSKGPLTRVRVGPFNNQSEAQAAVEKIKALQLDAIIVQP